MMTVWWSLVIFKDSFDDLRSKISDNTDIYAKIRRRPILFSLRNRLGNMGHLMGTLSYTPKLWDSHVILSIFKIHIIF